MAGGRFPSKPIVLEFYFTVVSMLVGHQVHFTNPEWARYIEHAVKRVCVTLGVKTEMIGHRYELHKLLVCSTDSQ